mmetsp:Transcript_10355/g.15574  ORF Transcript_10355/g.15574 Transcript_10355/m.15574 type:complete len:243 (-) Transcript_10355:1509-2237(-)
MTAATNSATAHLPLLPSARKKRLLQHYKNHSSNNLKAGVDSSPNLQVEDDDHQQKKAVGVVRGVKGGGQHRQEGVEIDDHTNGIIKSKVAVCLESTIKHPLLPLPPLNIRRDTTKLTTKPAGTSAASGEGDAVIDDYNLDLDLKQYKQLREEQLKTFSTMPPLSASTTTNTVMHFMHTTLKFMNSISAEVGEKLELCENSIEDLEIKLSMVESKLSSMQYLDVVDTKDDDEDNSYDKSSTDD